MVIGDIELPDSCPEGCPNQEQLFDMGGSCSRCPVFNCSDPFPLIEPHHFNRKWAEEYKAWFDSGFSRDAYPTLNFYLTVPY